LLLSLLLVIPFGLNGALLNAVTSQSLIFLIALFIVKKHNIIFFSVDHLLGKIEKAKAAHYFKFTCMALVSAFTIPVSQLIIRGFIINEFSIQSAGCWEGMNRLSGMYLMVITSSFGVYYLPKLSETFEKNVLRNEIKKACIIIIPCLLFGLPTIYFCRNIIINILFSPEFYQMSDLFFWQLIGDFFKISSWLIAYLMLAKAMTMMFIITEILFTTSYVGFSFLFGNMIGLQGIVFGYAINYLMYSIVIYFLVFRRIL
jgi:PST family polysaccharide transporter